MLKKLADDKIGLLLVEQNLRKALQIANAFMMEAEEMWAQTMTNLQRQILHNMDRIGDRKVDSAKKSLTALNPDVNVVAHDTRLGADNVVELLSQYDLVVDGADNFPSRYLLNDASLKTGTPVVHGSIFRFEGQVTVFDPYNGPCYRCMLPEPPPPELAPSCSEAGVLGVLPGIVGSIQALETIKLLLDLGDPLRGRLLAYDALEQSFRTFKVRRDPTCPTCGDDAPPIVTAVTCPVTVSSIGVMTRLPSILVTSLDPCQSGVDGTRRSTNLTSLFPSGFASSSPEPHTFHSSSRRSAPWLGPRIDCRSTRP